MPFGLNVNIFSTPVYRLSRGPLCTSPIDSPVDRFESASEPLPMRGSIARRMELVAKSHFYRSEWEALSAKVGRRERRAEIAEGAKEKLAEAEKVVRAAKGMRLVPMQLLEAALGVIEASEETEAAERAEAHARAEGNDAFEGDLQWVWGSSEATAQLMRQLKEKQYAVGVDLGESRDWRFYEVKDEFGESWVLKVKRSIAVGSGGESAATAFRHRNARVPVDVFLFGGEVVASIVPADLEPNLEEQLWYRTFETEELLRMIHSLAGMFEHAHAQGFTHGNIAISNIQPENGIFLVTNWERATLDLIYPNSDEMQRLKSEDVVAFGRIIGDVLQHCKAAPSFDVLLKDIQRGNASMTTIRHYAYAKSVDFVILTRAPNS